VPYPDGLRREIEANLADACDRGIPVARGAGELGVPPSTLTLWRRRAAGGPFRPVALTAPAPAIAPPPLVVVTAAGLRVEGLDLAGVVTLLRTLA
jgi:transposase-like protein